MVATIENLSVNIAGYFNNVLANKENLLVSTDNGNLIVIPEDDWEQMNETINLIRDKKSLEALLDGIDSRKQGLKSHSYSQEEIFDDLQN
ncbi:MAG: Antitoxin [Ignavibacteria bacterium]|nr:Antitoxin [Ignavibacteria bacterium]